MTKRILSASISGMILVLAFPPIGLGLLAWAGLVPLLYSIDLGGGSRAKGFLSGYICGFVFFLGTIYWVIHSMYFYGGVPVWISTGIMLLLVLYLSIYPGLFGLLFSMTAGADRILRIMFAGAFWAGLEYLRGYLFTGFPWVLLGYSQASYLHLIQVADTTGVWGISFLITAVNAAIYFYASSVLKRDGKKPLKEAVIALALVSSVFLYGFIKISQADKEIFSWTKLKIGIAQGSVDQGVKWDASFQDKTLEIYRDLSLKAASEGARLIIWPETAIPFYFEEEKVQRGAVGETARKTGSYLLTGSPSYNYNQKTKAIDYFNSAYLLSPNGEVLGKYDKVHLVPFGEYVPLKRFLPFIHKLTAGVGDFSSGPGPVPIGFNNLGIGTLVCFESIFPDLAASTTRNGASILVNITNDAWFGWTSAPFQHFQMSILRAVENKSFLLRSANTGISAVIDPVGRIRMKTGLFEKDVIVDTIGLRQGPLTFYSAHGDLFAYGCLAISGIFILRMAVRKGPR